ncbi:MAG: acyltransferase [Alphaproteobacteria bacterium]|nr:acyltransferase [Alphaproteobacteria bacterium]
MNSASQASPLLKSRKEVPALTGLRGIGAIWVVAFHMDRIGEIFPFRYGYLGVDIFFILSGYILAYRYSAELRHFSIAGYGNFLWARIARIYPLHLVMLCVLGVLVLTLPGFASRYPMAEARFSPSCFAASAMLVQNWAHWLPTCWNGPSWSLSAEWFAYLAFPVFLAFTQPWRSGRIPFLLAIAAVLAFGGVLALAGVSSIGVTGTLGMVRMASEFGAGCLLFRAQANGFSLRPNIRDCLVALLLGVGLLVPGAMILVLPSCILMVLAAAQGGGLLAPILGSRPIHFLGEISYSIYLVHWIVLQFSTWLLGYGPPSELAIRDVGLVVVILVLSYVSYHVIEQPGRAWARRIGQRRAAIART